LQALAFIRAAGILGALLLAGITPVVALEPNDLWPGMGKGAAVSVYTGHRSCGNYEFREEPDAIGWDASLYGRPARVDIQFEDNTATSILIVLLLEAGDDGDRLFESLLQERIRDLGSPLPGSSITGSSLPGRQITGTSIAANPASSNPVSGTLCSSWPDTVVWVQDDHLVSLERWPRVPAEEIHITRSFRR
jgi:hypothetical protein